MSLPTLSPAATGHESNGLYDSENGHFASSPLPTIIEETETWSKKAGSRKGRNSKESSSLRPSLTFSHMNLVEKMEADNDNQSEDEERDDLFREDVHLVSRTSSTLSLPEDEDCSMANVGKRALHSQQSNRLHRSCFNKRDINSTSPDDEYDEDDEKDNAFFPAHHKSASFTQENNSSYFSSSMAHKVLSSFTRPFTKSGSQLYASKEKHSQANRRNRRTQTDTRYMQLPLFGSHISESKGHLSNLPKTGELKRHQRFLQSPSFISFSSPSRSGSSFPHCFKLLLRQLRFPLAILCFVFFFVIQFRAPQRPLYGNIQQVQSSANLASASASIGAPQAAVSLFLSSNSETFASAIVSASNGSGGNGNFSLIEEKRPPNSTVASSMGVAAPVGSNVLVNRDLQAMPAAASSQVETTEEMATSPSHQLANISITSNLLNDTKDIKGGSNSSIKPPCPLIPAKLVGRLKVLRTSPPMPELESLLPEVQVGGRFRPPDCSPKFKVAIIVPYRDRDDHLRAFLYNIHPMLMRQNIEYGIFIVEQAGKDRFNRAKLMNVGFLEARNHLDYDCFIFHDVDLIPEDDRNLYTCPEQPRHMSVAIDKFKYRLPYKDLFGGVSALTRQQFETVNGFSNEFWGWGGEDDDMSNRVRHHKFKITRYKPEIARYTMLKHEQDAPSAERYKKLYNGWRRYKSDGINSTKYSVLDTTFKKLYTWILVDIFPPPMAKKKPERKRSMFMKHSSRIFPHRSFSRRPF